MFHCPFQLRLLAQHANEYTELAEAEQFLFHVSATVGTVYYRYCGWPSRYYRLGKTLVIYG